MIEYFRNFIFTNFGNQSFQIFSQKLIVLFLFVGIFLSPFLIYLVINQKLYLPSITRNNLRLPLLSEIFIISLLLIPLYYMNFRFNNFGHNDELSYLTNRIGFQVWDNRYFPLGHNEWRVLSLSLAKNNLFILHLLPLFQFLISGLLLQKIISKTNLWFSSFASIIIMNLSIVPFFHLIVTERNCIFFIILALYLTKFIWNKNSKSTLIFVSFIISISLYYKELMFVFWLFGLTGYLLNYLSQTDKKNYNYSHNLIKNIKNCPEVLLVISGYISSFLFYFSYKLYYFFLPATRTYGNKSLNIDPFIYFQKTIPYVIKTPIIPILVFGLIISFLLPKEKRYGRFLLSVLNTGGIGYVIGAANLNLWFNGFYYSIPLLAISITISYLSSLYLNTIYKSGKRYLLNDFSKIIILILFSSMIFLNLKVVPRQLSVITNDIYEYLHLQNRYEYIGSKITDEILQDGLIDLAHVPRKGSGIIDYSYYSSGTLLDFIKYKFPDLKIIMKSDSTCRENKQDRVGKNYLCTYLDRTKPINAELVITEGEFLEEINLDKYKLDIYESPYITPIKRTNLGYSKKYNFYTKK